MQFSKTEINNISTQLHNLKTALAVAVRRSQLKQHQLLVFLLGCTDSENKA